MAPWHLATAVVVMEKWADGWMDRMTKQVKAKA